ncbi:hypothetical protein [Nannocystis exedens]|nr:hypothetical protein [Nannocystis exedens]
MLERSGESRCALRVVDTNKPPLEPIGTRRASDDTAKRFGRK